MMTKNAGIYRDGRIIRDGACFSFPSSFRFPLTSDHIVIPGLVDVHVHFREPGFSYKESIRSGSEAAARAGYAAVCCMPNLDPVPDSPMHLQAETDIIRRDARIRVLPYGALTRGERGEELSDLAGLAPHVVAFSDDGRGVQSESLMRSAMEEAKRLGRVVAAHCEDNRLVRGGYIHDGEYARRHGHRGICSESEWGPLARDLRLARETRCAYHVCHVSCRESVDLIRAAKAEGVDVTCETAPHYLLLSDADLQEDGRFKMNPPLRTEADREALLAGLADGTVDMIATDHAPHSAEEKSRGLAGSLMGISGIEIAFPLLYTHLVRPGLIPFETLIAAMTDRPRRRFGIPEDGDTAIFDLAFRAPVCPENFLSQGKSTPFAGWELYGKCIWNQVGGVVVWQDAMIGN